MGCAPRMSLREITKPLNPAGQLNRSGVELAPRRGVFVFAHGRSRPSDCGKLFFLKGAGLDEGQIQGVTTELVVLASWLAQMLRMLKLLDVFCVNPKGLWPKVFGFRGRDRTAEATSRRL